MSVDVEEKASAIVWHDHKVSPEMREANLDQKGRVFWLTGLSGAGKSHIANSFEWALNQKGIATFLLDGDNVRHGLCRDLGMTDADRHENIRRVGEVAKLMADAGLVVICALISPFRSDRAAVRAMLQPGRFCEVYVATPLEVCEQRDPKGLYKKARLGQIVNFTGLDSPYEPPLDPEIVLGREGETIEEAVQHLLRLL